MNFGGIWGSWFALCAAEIGNVRSEETEFGMIAGGGDLGILTTAITAQNTPMSRGRARLINVAGVVGTVFGLGTAVLTEVGESQTAFALMGAGSVAGLLIGHSATKNYDQAFHFKEKKRFGILGQPYGQVIFESRWSKPVRVIKLSLLSFKL